MPTFEELEEQNADISAMNFEEQEQQDLTDQAEYIEDPDNPVGGTSGTAEQDEELKNMLVQDMTLGNLEQQDQQVEDTEITSTEFSDMDLAERTSRSLIAGSAQVVEGVGDMINALTIIPGITDIKGNALGNAIKEASKDTANEYANYVPKELRDIKELNFDLFTNPIFWTDNVAKGVPYLASFIGVGAVGAAASKVALRGIAKGMMKQAAKGIAKQTAKGVAKKAAKKASWRSRIFGQAEHQAKDGLLHGGKGFGKVLRTDGALTSTGQQWASTIGGGVFSNQMTSVLQASQALEQARGEKDEFGRNVFSDEQIKQIASNTHLMNTAYVGIDMLSWGMSFGKLGKSMMSMPTKMGGEISKLGAKAFGKNASKFMGAGIKGAALGTFEGLEETYQEVFEEWTAMRATEMMRKGESLTFTDFVGGMMGGKEWDSYKKTYDSDKMAEIKAVSFALGALSGGGKAFIDGLSEEQAMLNERGEIVNEHLANAQQMDDLRTLQRQMANNTMKDIVLDEKQEYAEETLAEWENKGIIEKGETQAFQEKVNEFTELHNKAIQLSPDGYRALFSRMVDKKTLQENVSEIEEDKKSAIQTIKDDDSLSDEAKAITIEEKTKAYDKNIELHKEEISDIESQIETLVVGKKRAVTTDKTGMTESEHKKYVKQDDVVDDEGQDKSFMGKVKQFFTDKGKKIVEKANEGDASHVADPKTQQFIEERDNLVTSQDKIAEDSFKHNDIKYKKDDKGNWTTEVNGKQAIVSDEAIVNMYNENTVASNKANFDKRNVYDADVENYVMSLQSKDGKINKRTGMPGLPVELQGTSKPLQAAIAMSNLAGRDIADLETIIQDQLMNASTQAEEDFWNKVKEDYTNHSPAELKKAVEQMSKIGAEEHFASIKEGNDNNVIARADYVKQMTDSWIEDETNAGNIPTAAQIEAKEAEYTTEADRLIKDTKYKERTVNDDRTLDGGRTEKVSDENSRNKRYDRTASSKEAIEWQTREEAQKRAVLGDVSTANLDAIGPAITGDITGRRHAKLVMTNRAVSKMFPGAKVHVVNSVYETVGEDALGMAIGATAFINADQFDQGTIMMHELSHIYASMSWDEPATQARVKFLLKNQEAMADVTNRYNDHLLHKVNEAKFKNLSKERKTKFAKIFGFNYNGDDQATLNQMNAKGVSDVMATSEGNIEFFKANDMLTELPMESQRDILEEAFVESMEKGLVNQFTNQFTEKQHYQKNKMYTRKWWAGVKEKADKHKYDVEQVQQDLTDGKDVDAKDLEQFLLDGFVVERKNFTGVTHRLSRRKAAKKVISDYEQKSRIANDIIRGVASNKDFKPNARRTAKEQKEFLAEWNLLNRMKITDEKKRQQYLKDNNITELDLIQEHNDSVIDETVELLDANGSGQEIDAVANMSNNNKFGWDTLSKLLTSFVSNINKKLRETNMIDGKHTKAEIDGKDFSQKMRNIAGQFENSIDYIHAIETSEENDVKKFNEFLIAKHKGNDVTRRAQLASMFTSYNGMNHDFATEVKIDKKGNFTIENATNTQNKAIVQRTLARFKMSTDTVNKAINEEGKKGAPLESGYITVLNDMLSTHADGKPFTRSQQITFLETFFGGEVESESIVNDGILLENGMQVPISNMMTKYFDKFAKKVKSQHQGQTLSPKFLAREFMTKGGQSLEGFSNAVVHRNQKFIASDTANSAENNQVSVTNKANALSLKKDEMIKAVKDGMKFSEFAKKYTGLNIRAKKDGSRVPLIQKIYEQIERDGELNVQLFTGIKNTNTGNSLEYKNGDSRTVAVNEFLLFLNGTKDTFLNAVAQNADSPRKFYIESGRINMKLPQHSELKLKNELVKKLMKMDGISEVEARDYFFGDKSLNEVAIKELEQVISDNRDFINSVKMEGLDWSKLSQDQKKDAIKSYHYSSMFASFEAAELFSPGAKTKEIIKRSKGLTSPFIPLDKNTKLDLMIIEDFVDKKDTKWSKNDAVSYILPEDAQRVQSAYGDSFPVGKAYKFVGYNQNQDGNTDYTKSMTFVLDDEFVKKHPKFKRLQDLMRARRKKYIDENLGGATNLRPFGVGADNYLPLAYSQSGVKIKNKGHKESYITKDFLQKDKVSKKDIDKQMKAISGYNDNSEGGFEGSGGNSFGVQGLMDKDYEGSVLPVQFLSALMIGTNDEALGTLNEALEIQEMVSDMMNNNRDKTVAEIDKSIDDFIMNHVSDKTDASVLSLLAEGISKNIPGLKHFADNLVTNRIKKSGNKLNTSGTIAFESSDFLFDDKLKGYSQDADGKVIPAEIVLPFSMKGKVKKGDVIFATRIPSHGLQTTAMFKVEGFNEESQGQMVMASNEVSKILGSDNDGDALYINTKGDNAKWDGVMDKMEALYSNPKMFGVLNTGITMEEDIEVAKKFMKDNGVSHKDNKKQSKVLPFAPMNRANSFDETVGAKGLVGVAANVHSIMNYLMSSGASIDIDFSFNGNKLSNDITDGGKQSGEYVQKDSNTHKTAMLMNVVLDNANDHHADVLNVNKHNLSASAILLRMGATFGEIGVINNSKAGKAWVQAKLELNSALTTGDSDITDVKARALEILKMADGKSNKNLDLSGDVDSHANSIAILQLMTELDSAGSDISKINKVMSGHNKLHSNPYVLQKQLTDFKDFVKKGKKIQAGKDFKNNPIVKRYMATMEDALRIAKDGSQTYNKSNEKISNRILEEASRGEEFSEKELLEISRALDVVSASRLLNMNNLNKKSLEAMSKQAIVGLALDEGYANSTLLKKVLKPINDNNPHISFNQNAFKHDNGVLASDFELIRNEFSQLSPELQQNLIAYDLVKNGHAGGKSFFYVMGLETLNKMSVASDKQLANKNKRTTKSADTETQLEKKTFLEVLKKNPNLVAEMSKQKMYVDTKDKLLTKYHIDSKTNTKGSDIDAIVQGKNIIRRKYDPKTNTSKVLRWEMTKDVDTILADNGMTMDMLMDLKNSNRASEQAMYDTVVREIMANGQYKETTLTLSHKFDDYSGLASIQTSDAKSNKPVGPKKKAKKTFEDNTKKSRDAAEESRSAEIIKQQNKKLKSEDDWSNIGKPTRKKYGGRMSRTNTPYYKYESKLSREEFFQVKKKSNPLEYVKYLTDFNKAEGIYLQELANGKIDKLTDKQLEDLYERVVRLDGLAGSIASTPLSIEKARREATIQSKLTGVDRGNEDMSKVAKWLGSNNITSKLPGLQKLARDMEVMFNKFLRERDVYYRKIETVTNELYKDKFGNMAIVKKSNPLTNKKDLYETLYGNLVTTEKGTDENGRPYADMKLKDKTTIDKMFKDGELSQAEYNFYKTFTEVTADLAPHNQSKKGLRQGYIPHTKATAYEAYANRGLLGVYMNSKSSASKVGDVMVIGIDPVTGKETTMKFKKFNDAYKAMSIHGKKVNPKAVKRYHLLRSKAEKLYDQGVNEDGSKLKMSRVETDTLLDQGALNRFEKSRSASAEDMPSMDLNKALSTYVHTALFTNGNKNVKGFNAMQQQVDGLIALYDLEGKVNARDYVQKRWKDKFLSGVTPTTVLGKTGDKVLKAGITLTLFKALALNYGIAVGNVIVGKYQNIRNAGGKAYARGEKRFWGTDKVRTPGEFIKHRKKVSNILRNNGFLAQNLYDEINIEEKHNFFNVLETVALGGMIYSEKWIQGSHYLGLITEDEWNAYDDEGNLKEGQIGVTPERQMEVENEVKDSHGKGYQVTDQRLISLYSFGQALMQFSRFIPTMFNERFKEEDVNIYGKKEIGSLRQFGRYARAVAEGDVKPKEFNAYYESLDDHNKKALRVALVSITLMLFAGLIVASGDDDDDRVKYAKGLISDANYAINPNRLVKKLNPPVLSTARDMNSNIIGMFNN